jgi:PAP2 superfamily
MPRPSPCRSLSRSHDKPHQMPLLDAPRICPAELTTLRQQAVDRSATSGSRTGEGRPRTPTGARTRITAVRELVLLIILYAGYTSARLLASNDRDRATRRAAELATIEHRLRLNWEHPAITLATAHPWLGVAASYWYSTAHYLLTPVVLVWLYRRHPTRFGRARTALALATPTRSAGCAGVRYRPW